MIPYRIELSLSRPPRANWLILVATLCTSLAFQFRLLGPDTAERFFLLDRQHPLALLTHLFLQRNLLALAAQVVLLWVFGNTACRILGSLRFLAFYLLVGAATGLVHLATTGRPPLGPGSVIASLVGFIGFLCPVCPVTLLHRPHSLFKQVPVWIVALGWVVWAVFATLFKIVPPALWAQVAGLLAGLGIAHALEKQNWLPATDPAHPSLLGLRHLAPASPPAAAPAPVSTPAAAPAPTAAPADLADFGSLYDRPAVPRAEGSMPTSRPTPPASAPTPVPANETPPPLQLRVPARLRTTGFAAAAISAGPRPVSAWPDTLPPGHYYYFDGREQHGPLDRALFLSQLSATADTGAWWYWVEGLKDWRPVTDLTAAQPAPPPVRRVGACRRTAAQPKFSSWSQSSRRAAREHRGTA